MASECINGSLRPRSKPGRVLTNHSVGMAILAYPSHVPISTTAGNSQPNIVPCYRRKSSSTALTSSLVQVCVCVSSCSDLKGALVRHLLWSLLVMNDAIIIRYNRTRRVRKVCQEGHGCGAYLYFDAIVLATADTQE